MKIKRSILVCIIIAGATLLQASKKQPHSDVLHVIKNNAQTPIAIDVHYNFNDGQTRHRIYRASKNSITRFPHVIRDQEHEGIVCHGVHKITIKSINKHGEQATDAAKDTRRTHLVIDTIDKELNLAIKGEKNALKATGATTAHIQEDVRGE